MGRKAFLIVSCVVVLGTARPAVSAGFDLFIDPVFGSTESTGSTAVVHFDFSANAKGDLLTLTFSNTTPLSLGSRLTAVGLEVPRWLIDPSATSLMEPDDYFDTLTFDAEVSPGWLDAPGGFDWMFTAEGSFLGGSPRGAPMAGRSASVVLQLGDTGMSPTDLALAFQEFYAEQTDRILIGRFQSVGEHGKQSDKVSGGVPEPGTLVLLALGGLALLRRARRH